LHQDNFVKKEVYLVQATKQKDFTLNMPSEHKNKIFIHARFLNICGLSAFLKDNNSESIAHNSAAIHDENLL